MKVLRPYQNSAIESLFDWYRRGEKGHPLVVAPVASGKSLLIAETIKRIHEQAPRTRIVVLSHVKELLEQNAAELHSHYPGADYGFYCAALKMKKLHNDITFASIQSVVDKATNFNRAPQVLLVDESHTISHNDNTGYRKFISECMTLNPNCKVIGFTGTPFRADTGLLHEGEGRLFDGIAYNIDIGFMIESGYLARPVVPKVETVMDTSGVHVRGGDYIVGELERAVDVDSVTQAMVKEIVSLGANRKKWMVFTAGISHCEHVRDAIRAYGITCEMVTGKTPQEERSDIIDRYKKGEIRCLVNVAVLTTGFNAPEIDLVVLARPTRSPVLYIQMIGRGLRTAPGKDDCMVLDFGNVIGELGPIDKVNVPRRSGVQKPKDDQPEAATKRCPSCGEVCFVQQRYCYICSYSFVQQNLEHRASDKEILSIDEKPVWYEVISVNYYKHNNTKDSTKPPTMRVDYALDIGGTASEFICFEHEGFALEKAVRWHFKRSVQPCPDTVDDALKIKYKWPSSVKLKKDGKYYQVMDYEFPEEVDPYLNAEEVAF